MATDKQRAPEGRALRWPDLTSDQQTVVNQQMQSSLGNARIRAAETRVKYTEKIDNPTSSDKVKESARKGILALDSVEPVLTDKPVSIESAANNRVDLIRKGAERVRADADASPRSAADLRSDAGFTWYFGHGGDLRKAAAQDNRDPYTYITAATSMSPQNSPENERAAAAAYSFMDRNNPAVKRGNRTTAFNDLATKDAASISLSSGRNKTSIVDMSPDDSSYMLKEMGRSGTNTNAVKGLSVLRGETHPDDAIDPHSSPKVWSYRGVTHHSVPGTPEHDEYIMRADMIAGVLSKKPGEGVQGSMDLWGLRQSHQGVLAADHDTAEDTWMNAVSSGQQLELPSAGSRTSPAKFVGSDKNMTSIRKTDEINGVRTTAHPDPAIGGEALRHAWNNAATVRAAQIITDEVQIEGDPNWDFHMPAVMAQETSWTEARRQANKDPQYRAAMKPKRHLSSPQLSSISSHDGDLVTHHVRSQDQTSLL
jgi:hypothetical protein